MKDSLSILNTKEIKQITKFLEEQWGVKKKFEHAYLKSTKNKIYLVSRDFGKLDDKKLKIEIIGLYFGEMTPAGLRLSIDGSQMVGPLAKKNVVEITKNEMEIWLRGHDLFKDIKEKDTDENCFVILKCGDDYAGCGKYRKEDRKILCFVPKNRRIMSKEH